MGSPRIPVPVRELLDERRPASEARRVWLGLEAKRARHDAPEKWRLRWTMTALAAVLGAVLTFLWMRSSAPAALHLADGRDVPRHLEMGAPRVAFDDGSIVALPAGARLELLESTGRAFALALRRGTATFDVEPGGPRRWRIECGPVTVEVVGTHFTVTRDDASVKVSVERGAVLVSGPPVPDHSVRLGPHQSIVVPLPRTAPEARAGAPAPSMHEATRVADIAPSASRPEHEAPRHAAPPPSVARSPAPSASGSAAPADAVEAPAAPDVAALLSRADEARLAGRYQEAAVLLERVVADASSGGRASLAEFSLGRLYLDSLGEPSRAAAHFSRALLRGLSDALEEDAYARLVESYARAGNVVAARDVANRYRARYPEGRRLDSVNRWSPPAP